MQTLNQPAQLEASESDRNFRPPSKPTSSSSEWPYYRNERAQLAHPGWPRVPYTSIVDDPAPIPGDERYFATVSGEQHAIHATGFFDGEIWCPEFPNAGLVDFFRSTTGGDCWRWLPLHLVEQILCRAWSEKYFADVGELICSLDAAGIELRFAPCRDAALTEARLALPFVETSDGFAWLQLDNRAEFVPSQLWERIQACESEPADQRDSLLRLSALVLPAHRRTAAMSHIRDLYSVAIGSHVSTGELACNLQQLGCPLFRGKRRQLVAGVSVASVRRLQSIAFAKQASPAATAG
ncbi:MAG: hypothetical protein Aurels2KO_48230 [Aureliella sp.]